MSRDRPAHLGPEYGAQFTDLSVVSAYARRPPYPEGLFRLLIDLAGGSSGPILDLGCGMGDVLVGLVEGGCTRIDAVDPSKPMLDTARSRLIPSAGSVRYFECMAETFSFEDTYSLVVTAESLHWMDWERVLPRIGGSLGAAASLAIVTERRIAGLPWEADLPPLLGRYSTNREYEPYDLVEELVSRALFEVSDSRCVRGGPFRQSFSDYVESFHSRNGFSRERMTSRSVRDFAGAVCELVSPHLEEDQVVGEVEATVVWGNPIGSARSIETED